MARQSSAQEYLERVRLLRFIVSMERALKAARPVLEARELRGLEIALGLARAELAERLARV